MTLRKNYKLTLNMIDTISFIIHKYYFLQSGPVKYFSYKIFFKPPVLI